MDKKGFADPNYTQTPNDLFEIHMSDMGEAELKVTLAVVRGTFGYHRDEFECSMSEMETMTGLSYNGILSGVEQAENRGIIERITNGKKTAIWRIKTYGRPSPSEGGRRKRPSPSEDADLHPVREEPSPSEEQSGIKENKRNKIKSPNGVKSSKVPLQELERLEAYFADLRGVDLPNWETDPKGAQKTWRTPLKTIREQCQTVDDTEGVINAAVRKMNGLTYTDPIQILKTAKSIIADRKTIHRTTPDDGRIDIY